MSNTGKTKTFRLTNEDDGVDTIVLLIPWDYIEKIKQMFNEENGDKCDKFQGVYFTHTGTFEN